MNFTSEDLEYLRSLEVKSIDILSDGMLKPSDKGLFDKEFYLSLAKLSKEEIENNPDLTDEAKNNYLDIKKYLEELGYSEPEEKSTANKDDMDHLNAVLTGIDVKLHHAEDIYNKALNLDLTKLEYDALIAKEPKTDEEKAVLAAYQDLLASGLVSVKAFNKDAMAKYLGYYNDFSSNVNSDLKTKILQIENLSYQDFFNAVTKPATELSENEVIIKEFIDKNLKDSIVMQNGTIDEKEEFLYGVVIYATAFIDTKNLRNLSDTYANYLFADDLSALDNDEYAKNQVIEVQNQFYAARKIARKSLLDEYEYGKSLNSDKILVPLSDYEEANNMPLADIKEKVNNQAKRATLLNIKEELISKYPEPEEYNEESYREYAKNVKEKYIDVILHERITAESRENNKEKLTEAQILADLEILDNESNKLIAERENKAEVIAVYKKYQEVLSKYVNKEELTQEEQDIFDTIKTYNHVSPDANLEEFARNKLDEYSSLVTQLTKELDELRKQSNAIKLAQSYLKKALKDVEEKGLTEEPIDEVVEEPIRITSRKDLLKKWLAFGLGFVGGIALSCTPGVGAIRMTLAALKLASSAVKVWTNKHPDGRIARVISNAKETVTGKFPRITAGLSNINRKLNSSPLNTAINGVLVGYLVGNIFEMVTGDTIYEAIKPGEKVIDTTVVPDVPESGNVVTDDVVSDTVVDQVVENVTNNTLIPGSTIDLSSISQGYVASGATNPVDLITSVGKDAVFDRAVTAADGSVWYHFKQSNGLGYAWFKAEVIDNLVNGISR